MAAHEHANPAQSDRRSIDGNRREHVAGYHYIIHVSRHKPMALLFDVP
jgi:hypothetical protein